MPNEGRRKAPALKLEMLSSFRHESINMATI
jgi:hypothetical protein